MVRIVTQLDVTGSFLSLRGEYISVTDVTGNLLPLRGEYISVTACYVLGIIIMDGFPAHQLRTFLVKKFFFFKLNIFFNITHIHIYIQGEKDRVKYL